MHLSDNELLNLSEQQLLHLQNCKECKQRYERLVFLECKLKNIPNLPPPKGMKKDIFHKLNNDNSFKGIFPKAITTAMLFSVIFIGYRFHLENELDDIVLQNSKLSKEIGADDLNFLYRSSFNRKALSELKKIDGEIQNAYYSKKDMKTKINLWKKRLEILRSLNKKSNSTIFI